MQFTTQTIGKYFNLNLEVLRKHIENTYNIKVLHPLEHPLKGYVNVNFIIESSAGKKLVRLYGAFGEHTEKELQIMQFLLENGFFTAKPLLNNVNKLISISEGYEYSIFEFIEGERPIYTSESFYRIGESVGKLQGILELSSIAIDRENHTLKIYERKQELIDYIQKHMDLLKDILTDEDYRIIQPQLEMFEDITIAKENIQLVHGDIYNPNIIDTGNKMAIIDFEYIAQGPSNIDKLQYLAWDGVCNSRTMNTPTVYMKTPYILVDQIKAYVEGYKKMNSHYIFNNQQDINTIILLNVGDTVFNLEKAIKAQKNLFKDYVNNYNNAKLFKDNKREIGKLLGHYS